MKNEIEMCLTHSWLTQYVPNTCNKVTHVLLNVTHFRIKGMCEHLGYQTIVIVS